jgi:hypothetical protein
MYTAKNSAGYEVSVVYSGNEKGAVIGITTDTASADANE